MQRIVTEDGLFHEGNPGSGQKGTKVTGDFLNDVQEEICNVILAAGIGLAPATRTQLLTAIRQISGGAVSRIITESGPVLAGDAVLLVDATAGPVTLTLLSADHGSAKTVTVIKIDATANAVTITAQAGQTLPTADGRQQSCDLTLQDEAIRLMPDGATHYHRI